MRNTLLIPLIALTIQTCHYNKSAVQTKTDDSLELMKVQKADDSTLAWELAVQNSENNNSFQENEPIGANQPKETRLRYTDFSIVFYDFKGYSVDYFGQSEDYSGKGYSSGDTSEAALNIEEKIIGDSENKDYKETLIVKKDTLHLSEDLDERINNTLIQIIPTNKNDMFKMSYCYLSNLGEIIDYRKYSRDELDKLYVNAIHLSEKTKYFTIKDSANFYFKALPHTSDMEAVTVVDGKVVPVKKGNTKDQIAWEQKQFEEEFNRIKKKYHLKDTLVVIPSESGLTATLTKDNKLFDYVYDSFLFRIDHYRNNKLIETKYIVIAITYGC